MKTIKNTSDKRQCVTWIAAFDAKEQRKVTDEEAAVLLNCVHFEEVKKTAPKTKKKDQE